MVKTMQENSIIQVGWIHTHPNHGVFLSSIEAHTQYRLQRDITGSVAIVYPDRDRQTGCFRLTAAGMQEVGKCHKDGFHEGCARDANWGPVHPQPQEDPVGIQAIDLRQVKKLEKKHQQDDQGVETDQPGRLTNQMPQQTKNTRTRVKQRQLQASKPSSSRQQSNSAVEADQPGNLREPMLQQAADTRLQMKQRQMQPRKQDESQLQDNQQAEVGQP